MLRSLQAQHQASAAYAPPLQNSASNKRIYPVQFSLKRLDPKYNKSSYELLIDLLKDEAFALNPKRRKKR